MTTLDFIVLPGFIILIVGLCYLFSGYINKELRPYFLVGMATKVIGAVALGLIYHYYYGYGDTIAFFKLASYINSFIFEDFGIWFRMMTSNEGLGTNYYLYSQLRYGSQELYLIRFMALSSLFAFKSYYGTAIIFGLISFFGGWCMFRFLLNRYPGLKNQLFVALFLTPSVMFWGSGLMKDTLIFASIGFACYGIFLWKKGRYVGVLLFLGISTWLISGIRPFMLLVVLIPFLIILFSKYTLSQRRWPMRFLASTFGVLFLTFVLFFGSGLIQKSFITFAKQARISANYLYRVSVKKEGSAYYLGELDGSIQSLINLGPDAVWVSLFRPYLWESNNLVMLLTSIESSILLLGFIYIIFTTKLIGFHQIFWKDQYVQFALLFTFFFAFIVGITTFNFGSLARYRMPILPFFGSALFVINHRYKQSRQK